MSLDLDVFFLNVPAPEFMREFLSFTAVMFAMSVVLMVFWYGQTRMDRDSWIKSYHTHWSSTWRRGVAAWLLLVIVAGLLSMAYVWVVSKENLDVRCG